MEAAPLWEIECLLLGRSASHHSFIGFQMVFTIQSSKTCGLFSGRDQQRNTKSGENTAH